MTRYGHKLKWIAGALLLPLLALGVYDAGTRLSAWISGPLGEMLGIGWGRGMADPNLRAPGPPRMNRHEFLLSETNAVRMAGHNDEWDERWCDVAGNYYSREFVEVFDYEGASPRRSRVFLRFDPAGKTFAGRIEAHGLKPHFAYQMKLMGVFDDRRSFEIIGRLGRWRLPGRGTNYTDLDYLRCAEKDKVDAYILFDFFVTDENGDAIRDFRLDSSLHVLYNWQRQRQVTVARGMVTVVVDASDPGVYARPKANPTVEYIWGEPEWHRYRDAETPICLPRGHYTAKLALTEESFHSTDRDGGYWATVYSAPVAFDVTP